MADMTYQERIMELSSGILEMVGEAQSINVPTDPRIDISVLTADDPDPKYVNVETIRSGVISKVNKRRYNKDVVTDVHNLTVGAQGYLGHPDPSKTSFEFRDPQGIYVGSIIQELEGGNVRAIAKMYMFKSSPLREWVPKSIAAGRPLTVSINGIGDVYRDLTSGVIDVKRINQLDSIDWANPGTEGVGTSQAMAIVSELQDNNSGGAQQMPEERQVVVRGVTLAEMKAFNPDMVPSLIKGVTVAELQAANPELVQAIQESAKITEMQIMIEGKQSIVKLADVQGMLDAKEAKIAELQGDVEKAKITEMTNKLLADVPDQFRDKIAKRISGNDEATIKASIDAEVAFIKEIAGVQNFDNLPRGKSQRTDDSAAVQKQVMNLFGVKQQDDKK